MHGIAIGLGDLQKDSCNSTVNGLKVEILGLGVGVGFLNSNTISEDSATHASLIDNPVRRTKNQVNGFNISLFGTIDDLRVNGVSLGGLAQYIDFVQGVQITGVNSRISGKISGVQLSGAYNNAIICHGIQMSLLGNKAFDLKGIQIGLFNNSEITRGFQFGLWNVNEKRSLPFINWNFKD
ncbi:LA_2272 family surface repeat-containing protein [Halocola ammonii]